ncbi:MAG: glucose-6-phosphate dehydrogenase, partial [Candidatus Nanohalarchaeota archaeon]
NEEFRKFQPFDIVLLGAGEDGHVAALFPQHHSIRHEGEEYFTMPDSPKPPVERLTASKKMLEGADTAIALFLGEGKRQALQNFKNPELSTLECPAKLIRNAAYPYVLTDNIERIKPFTLVIFGGTGDLATRKIAPAIVSLVKKRAIPMDFSIVGIGRRSLSDEEYKNHLLEFDDTLNQNIRNNINIRYFQMDMSMPNALEGFEEYLSKSANTSGSIIYYLATSNDVVGNVIDQLKKYNLHKHPEYFRRIVFEKPFGDCLESSVWLDRKARNVFPEESIYRIDHYLGKYAVQNILAFRFSNPLFEHVWNNKNIEQINILVDEELGAGNRIAYYDTAGAIKDMVQNHLLQIVSLILMNAPKNLEEKSISNEKVKALKAVDIHSSKDIVIGQYEGYLEEAREAGIAETNTETFVEVKLFCNNKRWRGIPIVLRTGKCLIKRRACIEIIFKQQLDKHKYLYPSAKPNTLFINIQPTKNISFRLNLKNPKGTFASYLMEHSHARFFGSRDTGTYERLIADCIRGDKTLFSRYDVLKISWKITDKILKLKENLALVKYREGSHGPKGFYEY